MSARERVMQNFSRAAAQYDALAQLQHRQSAQLAQLATRHYASEATLLDIGCGTAQFAQHSRAQTGWHVIGLDFAYGMCEIARTRAPAIQADAVALPIASASCDGVVSSLCLQWLDALEQGLKEIHRVLKPGGTAILITLGTGTLGELHRAASAAQLNLRLRALAPASVYESILAALGFTPVTTRQEIETEYYPDVRTMLDAMRAIGAGADAEKMQGFAGATRWRAMLAAYETARAPQGLPLSWEHVTLIAKKPL